MTGEIPEKKLKEFEKEAEKAKARERLCEDGRAREGSGEDAEQGEGVAAGDEHGEEHHPLVAHLLLSLLQHLFQCVPSPQPNQGPLTEVEIFDSEYE